ncbi:MAG TPA: hypothetical protein VHT26_02670 [Trebonia sp.]|nr:hypothetical protein [Trebonia sp.]
MTMEEQRLSELLKRSVPEPPLELSADRVTVQHIEESRKSWLMPALAAAAVVLVAGAGVGLNATRHGSLASPAASSAPPRSQVTSTAASTTGQPAEAPASFNPLALPVNFGWLPSGFTENLPAPGEFPMSQGPLEVMTTQVNFGASTPGGEGLQVTVAARGVKATPWIGGGTGSSAELAVIGSAPDINGRPAKWLADGLEWEYANGGWATILTGGESAAQSQAGWGQNCKINIPKSGSTSTGTATPTRITSGMQTCSPLGQKTATLQAELVKVASNLSWTATPFTFPYEFTQALPNGWTVGNVTGTFVKGRLIASDLELYSAAIPDTHSLGDADNVLDIQAWSDPNEHSFCPAMTGSYFATYNGVKWQIGNSGTTKPDDESWATACTAPVDAHGGSAGVGFDTYSAKNNQIGLAAMKAIVPIIKFFPANPAGWTTSPLAK